MCKPIQVCTFFVSGGRSQDYTSDGRFIKRLAERDKPLREYTDGQWIDSVDSVVVQQDGGLVFRFQRGKEFALPKVPAFQPIARAASEWFPGRLISVSDHNRCQIREDRFSAAGRHRTHIVRSARTDGAVGLPDQFHELSHRRGQLFVLSDQDTHRRKHIGTALGGTDQRLGVAGSGIIFAKHAI